MSYQSELSIKGCDKLIEAIELKSSKISEIAQQKMMDVVNDIQSESVRLTPIKTGELRSRAFTDKYIDDTNKTMTFVVGYEKGDPHDAYAVFVHENLQAHHDVGQAKFLETAFMNHKEEFLKVAKAVMMESMKK